MQNNRQLYHLQIVLEKFSNMTQQWVAGDCLVLRAETGSYLHSNRCARPIDTGAAVASRLRSEMRAVLHFCTRCCLSTAVLGRYRILQKRNSTPEDAERTERPRRVSYRVKHYNCWGNVWRRRASDLLADSGYPRPKCTNSSFDSSW